MNITKYFNESHLSLNCDIHDRNELFEFMVDNILQSPVFPISCEIKNEALNILKEREKHNASNMGNGIFVPHARISGIKYPAIAMATLNKQAKQSWIEKYSIDANIFIMIIIPKEQPTLGLQLIAGVAEMFEKSEMLSKAVKAESTAKLYEKMQQTGLTEHRSLRLRNIMNRNFQTLNQNMKLSEAVRIMHINRANAMAVVDNNDAIVGEVNSDMLLSHGIPDFFKNLSTVSFIREFDPLEKYFANEGHLSCKECMNTQPCCLDEDATIMESIFELSICGKQQIYVVKDNKLIGTVDRSTVLDRLLNI